MTTFEMLAIFGALTGIIGALTGTAALAWEIFKSRSSVTVDVATDAFSLKHPSPLQKGEKYIIVTVTNVGGKPVKISTLTLSYYANYLDKLKNKRSKFLFVPDPILVSLPHVIPVGEDWSGAILQSTILKEKIPSGIITVNIKIAGKNKPKKKVLKLK